MNETTPTATELSYEDDDSSVARHVTIAALLLLVALLGLAIFYVVRNGVPMH